MSLAAILAFLHSSMMYFTLSREAFATVGFIPESYNCLPVHTIKKNICLLRLLLIFSKVFRLIIIKNNYQKKKENNKVC